MSAVWVVACDATGCEALQTGPGTGWSAVGGEDFCPRHRPEPPVGSVVVARDQSGRWHCARRTRDGWRVAVNGYAAVRWADLVALDIVAVYGADEPSAEGAT